MKDGGREAVLTSLNVSRETSERLDIYFMLLKKWNKAINLVSSATLPNFWTRHVLDSAQLLDLAPKDARTWVDLGSGGGFPGLVIAILAAEKRPDLHITLVESDLRKSTFLSTVSRDAGVNTTICGQRIEDIPPLNADILSARALAPLTTLLEYAKRHLAPGGTALFPKGANHEAEIAESLERWRFSVQKHPSRTDPDAVIFRIGDIQRA